MIIRTTKPLESISSFQEWLTFIKNSVKELNPVLERNDIEKVFTINTSSLDYVLGAKWMKRQGKGADGQYIFNYKKRANIIPYTQLS